MFTLRRDDMNYILGSEYRVIVQSEDGFDYHLKKNEYVGHSAESEDSIVMFVEGNNLTVPIFKSTQNAFVMVNGTTVERVAPGFVRK